MLNIIISASLITITILALCVSYLYYDVTNSIINPSQEIPDTKLTILTILLVLPLIFLLVIVWAYTITNKLVGAFDRILKELDEVIAGKQKRHLSVRKGDELAEEVVRRINLLIDRLP